MSKIKLGEPIEVRPDKRMHDHVMDAAMGDVIDALVELITNSDDSYGRLYRDHKRAKDGGKILIERCEQRKGQLSYLVIRDHAEGMTIERMVEILRSPGAYTSTSGDRGYMGRGAKDCSRFGKMTFESIKDNKYHKCVLTKRAVNVIPMESHAADEMIRKQVSILHGNGTVVTLEVDEEFKIPQLKTLSEELSSHFALQDILDEKSSSEVLIRNGLKPDEKPERLISRHPESETILKNHEYYVPEYPGIKASLSIYKVSEPFEDDKPPRTRRYGFLIVSKRTIHERSILDQSIDRDPNSRKYFGRIECENIDILLNQYEKRRKLGESHPPENPRLIVDPERRHGLEKDHPFTSALFKEPIATMRGLLDKDRKEAQSNRKEIANRETTDRLDRLAKAASRFLQQQIDDLEELSIDEDVDDESFVKTGVLIYPTYLNVFLGKECTLTVYVNKALIDSVNDPVVVSTDSNALEVLGSPFILRTHKSKEDKLIGTFKVRGKTLSNAVCISAKCNGLPSAEAIAQVVEEKFKDHIFEQPLEFERDEYHIRYDSEKGIKLFAKVPDLIQNTTEVIVLSKDNTTVGIRGKCILIPVHGTNYAEGDVRIHGKRLKAKTKISASVNGNNALTEVKVIDNKENRGPRIRFELRDEDYGNFRAQWAVHEGRPNVLLIAGRHKSLIRYLGRIKNDGTFPGQDNPIYRVLLAEIVAEAVCRKSLQLETKERPWDFKWADLKDDEKISDDVIARLQQRLREFLPIAHRLMVQERDANQKVIIESN